MKFHFSFFSLKDFLKTVQIPVDCVCYLLQLYLSPILFLNPNISNANCAYFPSLSKKRFLKRTAKHNIESAVKHTKGRALDTFTYKKKKKKKRFPPLGEKSELLAKDKENKGHSSLCCGCTSWNGLSTAALCDSMGCSLPGSSIHGIFQARVLEWVAISFSRGSSQQPSRGLSR